MQILNYLSPLVLKFVLTEDTKKLKNNGHDVELESVLQDVVSRDKRDAERETSPLVIAKDAIKIDTSSLTIKDAVEVAISYLSEKYETAKLLK